MKKVLLTLAVTLVASAAFAQTAATKFYPGWFVGAQGGVAYTAGESSFKNLTSPNVSLNFGYKFSPVFTLRGDFGGYQAKGYATLPKASYGFNYVQGTADAMFDVLNIFKYKSRRAVNPYIFIGAGANYRFNNDDALNIKNYFDQGYLWDGGALSFMQRVGAGVEFRVTECFSFTLEYQNNFLEDRFNSKKGTEKVELDYQMAGLAGVKFNFGSAKKKAIAIEEEIERAKAAAAEAERIAAEKAAKEKAAAEKAAKKAAKEKAAAEKAAAEKAAAEKAAAEAAAAARAAERAYTVTLTFFTEKSFILEHQKPWVDAVIERLNQYPEAVVLLSGYADKETGEKNYNMDLSERRAKTVAKYLTKRGIDPARITVEFFGDTKAISPINKKNRACVIEVK